MKGTSKSNPKPSFNSKMQAKSVNEPIDVLSAFNSDGSLWACVTADNRIQVWEAFTGKMMIEVKEPEYLSCQTTCMVWNDSNNSSMVAVGNDKGVITIWDMSVGEIKTQLKDSQTSHISALCFSGSFLYCQSADRQIMQWSVDTMEISKRWKSGKGLVSSMIVHPQGHTLVTGGSSITLWKIQTGKKIVKFAGHQNKVVSLLFSKLGNHLFSCAKGERIVNHWDFSSFSSADSKSSKSSVSPSGTFCSQYTISNLYVTKDLLLGQAYNSNISSGIVTMWSIPSEFSSIPINPLGHIESNMSVMSVYIQSNEDSASIAIAPVHTPQFHSVKLPIGAVDEYHVVKIGSLAIDSTDKEDVTAMANVSGVALNNSAEKSSIASVKGAVDQESLKRKRDVQNNLESVSKQSKSSSVAEDTPSSGSLEKLLTQSLHSQDKANIEFCLRKSDENLVSSTVARISSDFVSKLLEEIMIRLQQKPTRFISLLPWLKNILRHHSLYLIQSGQLEHLKTLYHMLNSRVSTFDNFLQVQGKLDLISSNAISAKSASVSHTPPTTVFMDEE